MLGSGTAGRRREPATPVAGRMRRRRRFVFFLFFHTIFFKKILAEFFYLDVHFSFLPFDKFFSVKIFLVIFFYLTNLFFEIFSTHQIFT